MTIVSKIVLVLAIVYTIWQLLNVRTKVRNSEIVVPPFVASTLVFSLFIVLVIIAGASPFHLLWLFPLSLMLGIALLFFPFGKKLIMAFLAFLAGLESGQG